MPNEIPIVPIPPREASIREDIERAVRVISEDPTFRHEPRACHPKHYPTLLQWQRDGDPRFGHWYATGVMLPDNWRDLL